MNHLNEALFLQLNAPAHPDALALAVAVFFARYAIWCIPLSLALGWMRGDEDIRRLMLKAAASGLAGLLINQAISLVWQHPRPFMIGLGHTYLAHASDSSFPSDHLTLLWAVAFSFLMHPRMRMAGLALSLLGLPVAWARIYLGMHFPFDMVGAMSVAMLSAWLTCRAAHLYLPAVYRVATGIHRGLFGKLIERGWVRG